MSFPLLSRFRAVRRSHAVLASAIILGAIFASPLLANPAGWSWKDQSGLLPYRDGASLDLLAANGGSWLASDHSRLYKVTGDTLIDLTSAARSRGMTTVTGVYSDDQNWIVAGRSLDSSTPRVFVVNGQTWTDISNAFSASRNGLEVVGSRGTWYGQTFTQANQYGPSRWTAFKFNPTTGEKELFPLTSELNNSTGGCFTEINSVRQCVGETKIVHIGENWYLIGGNSELTNDQGKTTQTAKAGIWKINGTRLTPITGLPAFRFVSGVWQGKNEVLLATSDFVTAPFSPDRYWLFNGTSLNEISDEALKVGLLSTDAREIQAADGGNTWMITVGKKLIRLDGDVMSAEDKTRDFFTTVTSNGQGVFMLGGAVSTMDNSFATLPLTAKLVQVREDAKNPSKITNVASRLRGPTITVSAVPKDNLIGDGKVYTFRVTAKDSDGIANTNILLNGAKIKTCSKDSCEFTETYTTNGAPTRTIEFVGTATDKLGYSNISKTVKLTIDRSSNESGSGDQLGQKDGQGQLMTLPGNRDWNRDTKSGTNSLIWRQPTQTVLADNEQTTIVVAAINSKGLGRINLLVNGETARSCDFISRTDIRLCTVTLTGSDYPAGTEIFVNAHIFNNKNTEDQSVWTEGIRIKRSTNGTTTIATTTDSVRAATINRPTFSTTLTVNPDSSSVKRGDTFTVQTRSQNTGNGLMTVEIYQNDQIIRACSVGTVVSTVVCDVKVDTTKMGAGTTRTYVARAMDTRYNVIWSNTRAVTVRDTTVQPQPTNQVGPITLWNWMAPEVSDLLNDRTTYSVGAWSENGIDRIEMVVDGAIARSCTFGLSAANRECSVDLSTNDYAHNHNISVNARIIDGKGNVAWSDVRSILMRRYWEYNDGGVYLPAYATISANKTDYQLNDTLTLKAKGWTPTNIDRVQIYVNGSMVANCPGNICQFTTAPITTNQIEYQARVIDIFGQSSWTGVIGINKK